ncbi:MAG: hypothetical protein SFU91_02770 [Chloroherpetonaceae bacterium]|nr:hypothetical protein [Chloroherpetonaceae bacterium]
MSASLKSTVLAIAAAKESRNAASEARHQSVQDILNDTAQIRKENQDSQYELAADLKRQATELHQKLSNERNGLTHLVMEFRNRFQNERQTLIQSIEASKSELRSKLKSDTEARLNEQEALMNHIHTFMDANRNEIHHIRQSIFSRLDSYKTERKEGLDLWNSLLGSKTKSESKESEKSAKVASQFAIQIPFAPSQKKHSRRP